MTLINDLKNICNNISGNVITIGLEYKTVESVILKNKSIVNLYEMNFNGKKKTKSNQKCREKGKVISIKKIKRIFKKKKIDYIVCNIEDISKFLRSFIKNSVYINKTKLYIYGTKGQIDVELLERRYKRYTNEIFITEYKDDVLIEIDNSSSRNNRFKDFWYHISDLVYDVMNFIGDILIG